jgi:hypothetical protein
MRVPSFHNVDLFSAGINDLKGALVVAQSTAQPWLGCRRFADYGLFWRHWRRRVTRHIAQ